MSTNPVLSEFKVSSEALSELTLAVAVLSAIGINSPRSADYDLSTWPGIGGNSPLYVRGGYLNYLIYETSSHLIFTAYPILMEGYQTVFSGNKASHNGGTVYFGNSNTEILVMSGTLLQQLTLKKKQICHVEVHQLHRYNIYFASTYLLGHRESTNSFAMDLAECGMLRCIRYRNVET